MSPTLFDEPGEWKLSGNWIFQWPEWWRMRDYNWVNFWPIRIGIESGTYIGRYWEVTAVVMGVGFTAELYHAPEREAFATEMEDRMHAVEEGEAGLLERKDCPKCDGMGSLFVPVEENADA